MGNLILWTFLSCKHTPDLSLPEPYITTSSIGTVQARQHILSAYVAQYNQDVEISMIEFANARRSDPTSSIILLLWGDSAWEQDLPEKAQWAWKEYERSLSPNDKEELALIKERLERP